MHTRSKAAWYPFLPIDSHRERLTLTTAAQLYSTRLMHVKIQQIYIYSRENTYMKGTIYIVQLCTYEGINYNIVELMHTKEAHII